MRTIFTDLWSIYCRIIMAEKKSHVVDTRGVSPREPGKSVRLVVQGQHIHFTKGARTFFQDDKASNKIFRFLDSILLAQANEMCKRIYRSYAGIVQENIRQRTENRFTIHPYSVFRWYWEMLMVLILSLQLSVLPVQIAFFSKVGRHDNRIIITNLVFDIICLLDVLINFRSAYMEKKTGTVVFNNRGIILHYLRTWFFLDFISSFPFDIIYEALVDESMLQGETALQRFTKIMGVVRVFRITRLFRYVYDLETVAKFEGTIVSIAHIVMVSLLFIHWNACIQYLGSYIEGFPPESWVTQSNLLKMSVFEKYSHSLYRSVAHILGMGYSSNTSPTTLPELWVGIICFMLGGTCYALFIAHVSNLILSLNMATRHFDEKVSEVKEYMRFRRVPHNTQSRVMHFYDHIYQKKFFNEQSILFEPNMSPILRNELLMHNCRNLLLKVSYLKEAPYDFLCDIICKLKFHIYFPEDIIIQSGTRGKAMYFIEHGEVNVTLANGYIVKTLHDGDYFGEIALLLDQKTTASVIAAEVCDIYVLNRSDFTDVLDCYPAMKQKLQTEAMMRLQESQCSDARANLLEPSEEHGITNRSMLNFSMMGGCSLGSPDPVGGCSLGSPDPVNTWMQGQQQLRAEDDDEKSKLSTDTGFRTVAEYFENADPQPVAPFPAMTVVDTSAIDTKDNDNADPVETDPLNQDLGKMKEKDL